MTTSDEPGVGAAGAHAPATRRRTSRARPFFPIALIAAALLGALVVRGLVEGRAALQRSDELLAKGEVGGAIAHAMRAAKWYVPFAPHPREGYDRLRVIARGAESRGDGETALLAWQAIRAGVYATRSFYTPYPDRLDEANAHIAALLASQPPPGIDRGKRREQLVQEHRALLERVDAPHPAAVVAMYAGLAAWLAGAWRAFAQIGDRAKVDGLHERRRRMISGALLAAAGFAAFIVALARA